MNLLRIYNIGAHKILAKDHCVNGTVTRVGRSYLYVMKRPVRIGITEQNTRFSHYITFSYTVDNIPYTGRLFVSLHHRCPQKGETIEVYYDPKNPKNYACYDFGPAVDPIGW